jgi:hypothetical protein
MMRVTGLSFSVEACLATSHAAARSFDSVFDALRSRDVRDHVTGLLPDLFNDAGDGLIHLAVEASDFFRVQSAGVSTSGANHVLSFAAFPSERYLELFAAIAGQIDGSATSFSHGWPILSVVGGTSTVAEAGGVTTAPGGGLA